MSASTEDEMTAEQCPNCRRSSGSPGSLLKTPRSWKSRISGQTSAPPCLSCSQPSSCSSSSPGSPGGKQGLSLSVRSSTSTGSMKAISSYASGLFRSLSPGSPTPDVPDGVAEVPGYVGSPIIGDASLEFVRDPMAYIQAKVAEHGPVFKCRIMNRSSVFVTSNEGVREMLTDKFDSYRIGFLDHMKEVLGETILFADGEELTRLREAILPLFNRESVEKSRPIIHQIIKNSTESIPAGEPFEIYNHFKRLASELSMALFLGMDVDEISEMVELIIELGKTHWHGFISVPLKFFPSFLPGGFASSIAARDQLLEIIRERMEAGKLRISGNTDFSQFRDSEEAARHVLVFITALIPKAFASLLTSFCIEGASRSSVLERCRDDEQFFDDTLLEVARLWPPFLGSRRIAKEDHELQGMYITANTPVIYMTYAANHDAKVFAKPASFMPERWSNENKDDRERVFTLGAGGRQCIGKVLVDYMFKECARSLISHWSWDIPSGQNLQYKWLPVSRPAADIVAVFRER